MTDAQIVPMFPLGTVHMPHMPLALRLFEPRYLKMLGELLDSPEPEFGVVLIERGHEVGGGDQRAAVGTMARILEVEAPEGFMSIIATGGSRFRVENWLDDDPYPRAEVTILPDVEWDESLRPQLEETESVVRHALAVHNEHGETWSHDVQISEDPVAASWQLAGMTPVGALDQYKLVRAESTQELLAMTDTFAREALSTVRMIWGEEDEADDHPGWEA